MEVLPCVAGFLVPAASPSGGEALPISGVAKTVRFIARILYNNRSPAPPQTPATKDSRTRSVRTLTTTVVRSTRSRQGEGSVGSYQPRKAGSILIVAFFLGRFCTGIFVFGAVYMGKTDVLELTSACPPCRASSTGWLMLPLLYMLFSRGFFPLFEFSFTFSSRCFSIYFSFCCGAAQVVLLGVSPFSLPPRLLLVAGLPFGLCGHAQQAPRALLACHACWSSGWGVGVGGPFGGCAMLAMRACRHGCSASNTHIYNFGAP